MYRYLKRNISSFLVILMFFLSVPDSIGNASFYEQKVPAQFESDLIEPASQHFDSSLPNSNDARELNIVDESIQTQRTVTNSFYELSATNPSDQNKFDKMTEIVDQRTQNSKSYLNADGSTTTVSAAYSINYFNGHNWREIDTRIRQDSSDSRFTHSMLENRFKVRLNNRVDKQSISFSVDDQSVTYQAREMNKVVGSVYGSGVIYSNAWMNTDMYYEAQNDQLKMELHLANERAPKKFSFEINVDNVHPQLNGDGSINFINNKGKISFQIPRPWVKDASSEEKRYDKLKTNLVREGNHTIIEFLLDDSNLQYPLIIDPTTSIPNVIGGFYHTLQLRNDGTVWAWGLNSYGQLGDGTTTNRTEPVQVSGLHNVISVASGSFHSIALKQDGTVWDWGDNSYGQLGNNSNNSSSFPVQVIGLTNIIAIEAGSTISIALKDDGTVWTWGPNAWGQLGNGTTIDSKVPVQVTGLTDVKAIQCGGISCYALKNDGLIWAWGYNENGQLGDGTYLNRKTPVQVNGLSHIASLAAGAFHLLALKQDGTVWATGYDVDGELGLGNPTPYGRINVAVQVTNLTDITAIAAGANHSIALKQDGTVWSWGQNLYGQLGYETNDDFNATPSQIGSLSNIASIYAGYYHNIVINQHGATWTWGDNGYGQLGTGANGLYHSNPIQVKGIFGVTSISGDLQTVALKEDGTVWGWGESMNGQLGTNQYRVLKPVQIMGISNVKKISAGHNYILALKNDGTIWGWGRNDSGQLSDDYETLYRVLTPTQLNGINNVKSIYAGNQSAYALKQDGTLLRWGDLYSFDFSLKQLTGLTNGVAMTEGTRYSEMLVLEQNGNIMTNYDIETGMGGLEFHPLNNLPNVIAIDSGYSHVITLKQDGSVWVWGENYQGQLGNGAINSGTDTPQKITSLSNIVAIAAGNQNSFALKQDGTVWAWGRSVLGKDINTVTPTQISGLSNIKAIAVGTEHFMALSQDGKVWTWGGNEYGQLGDGSRMSIIPTSVFDEEPPTVPGSLLAASITPTSITLEWTPSTDNAAVVGYEIYTGSTYVGTTTSTTYTIENLQNGVTYSLTIKAIDAAGNISTTIPIVIITGDTQPPSVPMNLSSSDLTGTSVTLNWTPSTDNIDLSGYDIYRNGEFFGTTTSATYAVYGLLSGVTYLFAIKAKDSSGNVSALSSEIQITTLDTEAPTVPTNLTSPTKTSKSVLLNWTASNDNVAIAGYYIYRDGVRVGTTTSTTYEVYGLTAPTTYQFSVTAFDAANNESEPSEVVPITTEILMPNVGFTVLSGTYQLPTKLTSKLTSIGWSQLSEQAVEAYRIRILNGEGTSSFIDSGILPHAIEQQSDAWTLQTELPTGIKLQAIIQVYDGQIWSDWSLPSWFIIDIPSKTKAYTYDRLNRISSVAYESGQQIRFTFDRGGNLVGVDSALNYHVTGDILFGTADPNSITVAVYGENFSYISAYNTVTDSVYGKMSVIDTLNMHDRVRYSFDLPKGIYTIVITIDDKVISRTVSTLPTAILRLDYGTFNFINVADVSLDSGS